MFKSSTLFLFSISALSSSTYGLSVRAPVKAPAAPHIISTTSVINDTTIQNFALTLEHVEVAFYTQALAKFDTASFETAGFPAWVRGRFNQLAQHESTHVAFLTAALGADATSPCEYSFPAGDAAAFASLSTIIEGVGTGAYLGASAFLSSASQHASNSILTTEARHQAWAHSAALKQNPWSGSFDTPLSFSQAFSLAAPFITSCPTTNPAIPASILPALTITTETPVPGAPISLSYTSPAHSTSEFLVLLSGLNKTYIPIKSGASKTAVLPTGLQGAVYALVSSSGTDLTDANTIAGPAVLIFTFDSYASNAE